jgi:hypothetical protein
MRPHIRARFGWIPSCVDDCDWEEYDPEVCRQRLERFTSQIVSDQTALQKFIPRLLDGHIRRFLRCSRGREVTDLLSVTFCKEIWHFAVFPVRPHETHLMCSLCPGRDGAFEGCSLG